jgi:hypothetical protein
MRKDTKNPGAEGTLLRQIIATEPIRGMDEETMGLEQQNERDVKS